ncbi:hypothetical protein FRC0456_02354 [Corynebacterium diphtheriae]|nr:hypothetical protein FRC0084_02289 [Corynebacterium diphtheriae]CAB0766153.1 hypothetical protein FRC0104_02424 [Corynebacterium diphtheriae]CAB0865633.1 hypothetical protein FRC0322_02238 [Corynebacterium diphtheriae]CAB0868011.1 hypothetical protein FRC0332_02397 [Corynebacterium diphtheriae]CAB0875003.1 hypothetical protein FRC0356_02433 [Corynebacterium diphtheriae]
MPDTAQQTRNTLYPFKPSPNKGDLFLIVFFARYTMLLLGKISTSHLNALLRFQIWPINPLV